MLTSDTLLGGNGLLDKKINKKTLKVLAKSDMLSPTFASLRLCVLSEQCERAGGREIVSIL